MKRTETTTDLNLCKIETLTQLPNSFAVFIGHAYGAPATSDITDYLAPNVERFLSEHRKMITSVIFTGDVFAVPSSTKWKKLFEGFDNPDIHVAPGNHDILRPDSHEVFKNQELIAVVLKSCYIKKGLQNNATLCFNCIFFSVKLNASRTGTNGGL